MQDFQWTVLDPARFPTADQMNTGTGEMMEARKRRWMEDSERAPMLGAFVMKEFAKHFKYKDSDSFQKSPLELEKLFAEHVGAQIPTNYLQQVEAFFQRIHWLCLATLGPPMSAGGVEGYSILEVFTPVLWASISVKMGKVDGSDEPTIALLKVAVRPCGETFGFFRLLLNELARNAAHFGTRLCIQGALTATQKLLHKAFSPEQMEIRDRCNYFLLEDAIGHAASLLGVEQYMLVERRGKRKMEGCCEDQALLESLKQWFEPLPKHTVWRTVDELRLFLRSRAVKDEDLEFVLNRCIRFRKQLQLEYQNGSWVCKPVQDYWRFGTLKDLAQRFVEDIIDSGSRLHDISTHDLVLRFCAYLLQEQGIAESAFSERYIVTAFESLFWNRGATRNPLHQAVLKYKTKENETFWRVGDGVNPMGAGWLVEGYISKNFPAMREGREERLYSFADFAVSSGFPENILQINSLVQELFGKWEQAMCGLAIQNASAAT